MERYRDLPKATQLAGGRAGMQSAVGLPRSGACVNPQAQRPPTIAQQTLVGPEPQ